MASHFHVFVRHRTPNLKVVPPYNRRYGALDLHRCQLLSQTSPRTLPEDHDLVTHRFQISRRRCIDPSLGVKAVWISEDGRFALRS